MSSKVRKNLSKTICLAMLFSALNIPAFADGDEVINEGNYDRSIDVVTVDDFVTDPDDPYDTNLSDLNRLDGNIYHHPILGDLYLTMMADTVEVTFDRTRGVSAGGNGYTNSDGEFTPSDIYTNESLNDFTTAQAGENERSVRHIIGADNRTKSFSCA